MLLLRTFGGLSLETGGRAIVGAAAQRRRLAILARLAVASGRPVSRDSLCALFWPEADAEHARAALRQALYALKRDGGEHGLTLGTTEVRLNAAVIGSDVGAFDRALVAGELASAVALYTGPFLDGIHISDAPEFERWSDAERARLASAHAWALESLARAADARGDLSAAVAWRRRIVLADPLSVCAACALMRTLAASGERQAAIRYGEQYCERIRAELEEEPDAGVLALVATLRTATISPPTAGRAIAPPARGAPIGPGPTPVRAAAPAVRRGWWSVAAAVRAARRGRPRPGDHGG